MRGYVSGHESAVCRWRPHLSAPTRPPLRHEALQAAAGSHSLPSTLSPLRLLPRQAPPWVSDLARALRRVSGQASPPKASLVPPLPRHHLPCHCRAQVRQHCRAPSSFYLVGVPPCSLAMWPGLLLHHFLPLLFL